MIILYTCNHRTLLYSDLRHNDMTAWQIGSGVWLTDYCSTDFKFACSRTQVSSCTYMHCTQFSACVGGGLSDKLLEWRILMWLKWSSPCAFTTAFRTRSNKPVQLKRGRDGKRGRKARDEEKQTGTETKREQERENEIRLRDTKEEKYTQAERHKQEQWENGRNQ